MKELIESKWEEILSLLETEYDISSIMINTWIRSLKIYEVKNNTVYFYVDEKLGENALNFLALFHKEFAQGVVAVHRLHGLNEKRAAGA